MELSMLKTFTQTWRQTLSCFYYWPELVKSVLELSNLWLKSTGTEVIPKSFWNRWLTPFSWVLNSFSAIYSSLSSVIMLFSTPSWLLLDSDRAIRLKSLRKCRVKVFFLVSLVVWSSSCSPPLLLDISWVLMISLKLWLKRSRMEDSYSAAVGFLSYLLLWMCRTARPGSDPF